LWIEDDFRVHRHRPVWYACFCKRHIEEFSRLTGSGFTREELAREILQPGTPSATREQWMAFEGSVMAEVLELLGQRVTKANPAVQLGLMLNQPSMSAMETRDWDRCMAAISQGRDFVTVRPGMTNYQEWSPRGLYSARSSVSGVMACIRKDAHLCTEIENWPFSRYSKSVRFTRAQVLLSAAMRCQSMTFNMYDHMGTPLAAEPQYGQMLKDARPMVDAMVAAMGRGGVDRGVRILEHEQAGKRIRLDAGDDYGKLNLGADPWADIIQAMGATVAWGAGSTASSTLTRTGEGSSPPSGDAAAVSGKRIQPYLGELDALFAKGMLLDAGALQIILKEGREDLVGVRMPEVFERRERITPAEELTDEQFGRTGHDYMTIDHLGLEARLGVLEPLAGARVISRLVDCDRKPVLPGVVLYENKLGGRVAVYPHFITEPFIWFHNWHRSRQLQAVINWLLRGKMPLTVEGGAWPLPIRTDYRNRIMVSVTNLSLDAWPHVKLSMHEERPIKRVRRLDAKGRWHAIPKEQVTQAGPQVTIQSPKELQSLDLAMFRIDLA
jgi:hypothetical protein